MTAKYVNSSEQMPHGNTCSKNSITTVSVIVLGHLGPKVISVSAFSCRSGKVHLPPDHPSQSFALTCKLQPSCGGSRITRQVTEEEYPSQLNVLPLLSPREKGFKNSC
jgi:hypothetical protein